MWSKGYIVPLFRKGDVQNPENYRGISIASCIGKLFALLLNNRLQTFLLANNIISNCQSGFMKNKRTSDHIFVLKCIIEEAKAKRQPIYGCFVDFKKAFDTIWIKGLLFKLLHKYSISPKCVRLLKSMYDNLKACVYSNNNLGEMFNVTVGTRQGCNLSPSLFNLYINDIPSLLEKANCNPVSLHNAKINCLLYADDMLVLSKSKKGLSKALHILEIYCQKWQLKINPDKTKIMIFNKIKYEENIFQIDGLPLETVKTYTYLGIKISNSGSFVSAIKELSNKAKRAYFAMKSIYIDSNINPKLFLKTFDALVKPISLYGCEIWGAFGHKTQGNDNPFNTLFTKDQLPYEQLHLKACKASIGVMKNTSNFGIRSELGRFPMMFNILVSICKYRLRLEAFDENDLLFHAIHSQQKLVNNAYNSMTYSTFTDNLRECLNIRPIAVNKLDSMKKQIDKQSNYIKEKCRQHYIRIFKNQLSDINNNSESKLSLYSNIKSCFIYEPYLNFYPHCKHLTKFRLSAHYLPIERGRYHRPKIPRHLRICTLCNSGIGDEVHAIFECRNKEIIILRDTYLTRIKTISPQINELTNNGKLLYLLKASDHDIIRITCQWLCKLDHTYKTSHS